MSLIPSKSQLVQNRKGFKCLDPNSKTVPVFNRFGSCKNFIFFRIRIRSTAAVELCMLFGYGIIRIHSKQNFQR
jgi:hypothetical protein